MATLEPSSDMNSNLISFLKDITEPLDSDPKSKSYDNKEYCRRYREKKRKKETEVSNALQSVSDQLNSLKIDHEQERKYNSALQFLVELRTSATHSVNSMMNSMSSSFMSGMNQAQNLWNDLICLLHRRMLSPSDSQLRIIARLQQHFVPPRLHDGYVIFVVDSLRQWEVETPQGRAHIEQMLEHTIKVRYRFLNILTEEKIVANPKLLSMKPRIARIVRESGCLLLPELQKAATATDQQKEAVACHIRAYHEEYAELQRDLAEGYELLQESLDDTSTGIAGSLLCLAQGSKKAEKAKALLEEFSHKALRLHLKLGHNIRQEVSILQYTYQLMKTFSLLTTDTDLIPLLTQNAELAAKDRSGISRPVDYKQVNIECNG